MANPTTKFVSVNLNKSYGQQQSNRPSSSPSPYHGGIASRTNRPGGGNSAGGGGGMVVLSRPRSSLSSGPKSGARLSVPPPLNLPSLRKEHERFDPSAGSGSLSGASSSGLGMGRGGSAVMGWNKPSTALLGLQDKDSLPRDLPGRPGSGDQRAGSPGGGYASPAKPGVPPLAASSSTSALSMVQRAVLLKGEDFPSLQASIISNQKQKDILVLKQKHQGGEELHDGQLDKPTIFASPVPMRPQMRPSHLDSFKELNGDGGPTRTSGGSSTDRSLHKLDDILPGPLPMVQLRHTSDWADDERDTGLAIPDRSKERSFSRNEASRTYDYFDQRGLHDSEPVGASKKELSKAESFGRDTLVTDRNANSWRSSMHPKDSFGARESALLERDGSLAGVLSHGKDSLKDGNRYGQFSNGGRDGSRYDSASMDIQQNRLDSSGPGQNSRTSRNGMDVYHRRNTEQNLPGRLADVSSTRFRGGTLQNNSFSSGGKGFPLDDPILNFRRFPTSSRKPYLDGANFDDHDTLTGGILGDVSIKAFRKKKDVPAPFELNDPVRESFEAELERVQRMQEEERQRVLQEHARALEVARKEEEERQRLAREEEERKMRLEQEARDAAWRAEQEKLEAARIAEEKRVARDEEKRRMLMEEERRKEAARQKLLELEARIAKRQAEEAEKCSKPPPSVGGNDQMLGEVKQQDAQKVADSVEWEDGERMVEQITSSTLSDSPSTDRFYGQDSSLPSSANGYVSSKDSGKQSTYWKNEAYDNGSNSAIFTEQVNGHHATRRDAFNAGRVITRHKFYSSSGIVPARPSSKGGTSEASHSFVDEYYTNLRGHRWNIPGDGDRFLRNNTAEPELPENDKFGEIGWERNQSSDGPVTLYGDSLFQNSGVEGFSSGRSKYFPRQPRVLPPPSFSSMPKNTFKMNSERLNSTSYMESESRLQNTEKSDKETRQETYESGYLESKQQHPAASMTLENASLAAQNEKGPSSLSQSSASVSSPPSSPDNMYHVELDNSGDLHVLPESADEKEMALSDDDCEINTTESGKTNNIVASRSVASREEDEWTVENNDVHAQDEYNDEHDYREEVDVHEDEDVTDIVQEFYLHPGIQNGSVELEQDQQVLGFNEGTEVRITSSDEFEIESDNDEKDIETHMIPNVARQEAASADGFLNNEDNLESVPSFLDGSQENADISKTTEKAIQNLVLEPVVSTTYSLGSQDMTSQPTSTSASNIFSLPSSLGQPILSSASTVHSQTETPMQLQFGLFSGPSLIPSPVPAIQIGSIQMPLSLHHPVRPFPHIHPSQPPFFQFGQLQYTSPISQGILPLSPQNMPFLQSSVSAQYSLTQNSGNALQKHVMPQSSALNPPKEFAGLLAQYKNGVVENSPELSVNQFDLKEQSAAKENFVNNSLLSTELVDTSRSKDPVLSQTTTQVNVTGVHDDSLRKSGGLMSNTSEQHDGHPEPATSQCVPGERSGPESRPPGSSSGRGKRYIYAIKNSSLRSQLPESETSRADNNVFQRRIRRNTRRMEFRVRETDKKQIGLDSFNPRTQDGKNQLNGDASVFYSRNGSRKETSSNRSFKSMAESEKLSTDSILSETVSSGGIMAGKDTVTKTLTSSNNYPHLSDGSLHRNDSEEDVDAPLLTGVVRVYKQPGIETPSDEDNFIEVRSKRQMLNDRREQREKEIKAKSRSLKAQQRARSLNHGSISSKAISREGLKGVRRSVVTEGSSTTKDVPSASAKMGPPTPIANGHLAGNLDGDSRSLHTNCVQMTSGGARSLGAIQNISEVMLENTALVNGTTRSTTSVISAERHLNQQVMTLTQTQLDEAMKPEYTCGAFRTHSDAVDSTKSSTSANPITSLLAGEKIQFGAVTTPTYLPPVNRVIHNSIGGSRTSCKSDPIERNSASRNDDNVFFNKEKHHEQSCVHLEDPEAEAEAAASAVAVAAISSDEIVSNDTVKENIQDGKNLSSGEESLIVSLPADLSVENPPSPWPILPSPQSSSNPMLSHFPGASPSHFPFFDMNPMLRGPMFTFGGQDDSVGSQSQPQKSSSLNSGPFGAWPQCPSGIDSIYGHPAGFAGPFLNPAAGMPGVQAPHPMVFYNHFSPLAQFGVSFMGGPFIPSGKQPEWRHNRLTSVGVSEPGISTQDACSAQNNPPSIAASIQHLAPGSLMPVASPLPLFEMPPFQQPVDIPVPAQWPNMTPPVHTIPLSPLHHHRLDSGIPGQVNNSVSVNPSSGGANFVSSRLESQPSISMDAKFVFPANPAAQLSNELGLVEPASSDGDCSLSNRQLYSPLCRNTDGQSDPKSSSGSNSHVSEVMSSVSPAASGSTQNTKSAAKPQTVTQPVSSSLPHSNPSGYNDKRVGPSQKVVSGGDWHRRAGFQGKKLTQGSEKNFSASKIKQIYVAKSPANGSATTG